MSNILIIYASGGGGLLTTALAKRQQIASENPQANFIMVDLMREWVIKIIGWFGITTWNGAQKTGFIYWQIFFWRYCMPLANAVFWLHVFFHALFAFRRYKIDRVIDTQPMGTNAIVKAMRVYRRLTGRHIVLEKVMSDLPTKLSTHFFGGIKGLSKNDRPFIKVISLPPLLEECKSAAEFWRKMCRLGEDRIVYENNYIRQAFSKYAGKPKCNEPFKVAIQCAGWQETELLQKIAGNSVLSFDLQPKDRVVTILLGSQPAFRATQEYVRNFSDYLKTLQNGGRAYIFVYCGKHEEGEESLFAKVGKQALAEATPCVRIIPMTFQKEEVIADLFYRSDITITRSGGQTIMELMSISHGANWIHSEAKYRPDITEKEIYKGIPVWEAGNARYLQKMKRGKVVIPGLCHNLCREL